MNLVLDVTQLAEWPGKLTGIPRVMNELSIRFAATGGSRMVVWDSALRQFQPITYQELEARREQQPIVTTPASAGALKRVARVVEARSQTAGRVRRRVQSALNRHQSIKAQLPALDITQQITRDDTLVVFWGAWADPIYIESLQQLTINGTRLIQFVYDMLPVVMPQFSGHATEALGRYAAAVYPISNLLLSISDWTKQDVMTWLEERHLRVPQIAVFRLGDDFTISHPSKPTDPAFTVAKLTEKDYLLVTGTIEARKNHALLYYVYKLAKQRRITLPKLVIVGRRGWLSDDIFTLMTNDPEVADMFVFLQQATDDELAWLYRQCRFTIYPSFYEGWGLPIAESIAHGVPCISSNTSSMPEIAGDLITYFSPLSTDECLQAIVRLLDPRQLASAQQKVKRYKPTSWDETFGTVLQHIKKEITS